MLQIHDPWSEDLAAQARRRQELGSALCDCDGYYHALWGSLRIAGVNNTMKGQASILSELMMPFVRDDMRVMIGGYADPGVLCSIGRIYAPRMPTFTVIDKCRAPLALIDEFVSAKGAVCRTRHIDLLDLDGTEQWDQIVLHYTADFMDTHLRGRLFRNLARSLVPPRYSDLRHDDWSKPARGSPTRNGGGLHRPRHGASEGVPHGGSCW